MRTSFRNCLLIYVICLGISTICAFFIDGSLTDQKSIIKQAVILFLLYLSGSIPFGLFIAKLITKKDVRTLGSGNIGTTNVLRTGSKLAAGLTLLFDLLKGLLAVSYLEYLMSPPLSDQLFYMTFLVPVLGHMFPCWLNFKGGKGIATGFGVMLVFSWPLALICFAIWLACLAIFRLPSLSGLISFGLSPLVGLFFVSWQNIIWLIILSALVFLAHKDNIKRILTGQEKKIGDSSSL